MRRLNGRLSGQGSLFAFFGLPVIIRRGIRGRSHEQCLVIAIRLHATVPEEEDAPRSTQKGDAMCRNQCRAGMAQLFERFLDQRLGLGLNGRCWFVQKQDARIMKKSSRDREALLLSA